MTYVPNNANLHIAKPATLVDGQEGDIVVTGADPNAPAYLFVSQTGDPAFAVHALGVPDSFGNCVPLTVTGNSGQPIDFIFGQDLEWFEHDPDRPGPYYKPNIVFITSTLAEIPQS